MSLAGQISLLAARIAVEVKANKTSLALKAATTYVDTGDQHYLPDPGEAATPDSFPVGMTISDIASSAWSVNPGNQATVVTFKAGGAASPFRVVQNLTIKLTGDEYVRSSGGTGSPAQWGTWQHQATLASPAFTGAPTAPTQAQTHNDTTIATTAFVVAAVAAGQPDLAPYAKLASPTFTGTVRAPTVAGSTDSSTQIATTAFVQAVAGGDAPLASPAFTGTPTAPTAVTGTSSTQIATTAYVQANLSSYAKLASPTFSGTVTMTQFTSTNGGVSGTFTASNITAGNNELNLYGTNTSGASAADFNLTNDGTGPRVWSNAIMNRTYTQASSNGVSSSTLFAVVTNAGTIGALSGGVFLPDVYTRNRSGQRTMLIQSDGSMGTSSSSIRVKNTHAQVVMDDTMLDAWAGLPTWTFDYKEDPDHHEHTGVIAEEVQAAGYFDDLIYYDERPVEQGGMPGQVDGFAYERMGVWNRLAIGRLLARVKELEARIPA